MNNPESAAVNSRRTGQSCPTHATKRGDLYCLTCEVVVCAECLIGSREHSRHSVDTVRDTYAGRFQETRAKLDSLNSHIKSLRREAEKCLVVLETVRRNEASMLDRLDRLMAEAKAQVVGASKKYAEQLEPLLLTTRLKSHNRDRIVNKIDGLSEGQFLAQQAEINRQCDGLMSNSMYSIPEQGDGSDGIECSLLPKIETLHHDLALDGRRFIPLSYIDRYAVKWNLHLERTDKLLLHLDTKEMIDLRGNFLFVLEILDRLPLKKTRIVVSIELPADVSHQITRVLSNDFSQLQNEKFHTKDGLVRIKYGIGPEDPITERNCYEFTLQKYRNKLRSVRDEMIEWKKYNIGHLIMVVCPSSGSKLTALQQSPAMIDANGVRWQLKVSINGKGTKGFVGAFLTKCTPQCGGWYDFFIELVHPRSERQNRVFKGCHQFEKQETVKLQQFMAVVFLDKFQDNGTLHFRFGIKMED
ncbi:uncharacterized protein LOC115264707 [Aedes albopictus]|uniref:B box-type domain-containing protein n=1 Tax=Aedes albopictus TaxID=7160 RepID=A0ABM1XUG6_AEDAL|nr:uncharacterized protein LOC109415479 [Aedes albopictus]